MRYDVRLSDDALRELKKLDRHQAGIIIAWLRKNLQGCKDPRLFGKPLWDNKRGQWRYLVGAYRIIADIQDDIITIKIINIGHRREVHD
jgi:mRNA interferase RelE/StbE